MNNQGENENMQKLQSGFRWMEGLTAIIATASIVTTIITCHYSSKQLDESKEANRISTQTAISTLNKMDSATQIGNRAYLLVTTSTNEEGGLRFNKQTADFGQINLKIINTGNTPAYKATFSYTIDTVPIPSDTTKINFMVKNESIGSLASKQPFLFGVFPHKIINHNRFLQNKIRVYVYGMVSYYDFFKSYHFTHFNLQIQPPINLTNEIIIGDFNNIIRGKNGIVTFSLAPLSTYNDAK